MTTPSTPDGGKPTEKASGPFVASLSYEGDLDGAPASYPGSSSRQSTKSRRPFFGGHRRDRSLHNLWATFGLIVGVVVATSLCVNFLRKVAAVETRVRRLAEAADQDDDAVFGGSPKSLEEACEGVTAFETSLPSSSEQRHSPLMVESFFRWLEASDEERNAAPDAMSIHQVAGEHHTLETSAALSSFAGDSLELPSSLASLSWWDVTPGQSSSVRPPGSPEWVEQFLEHLEKGEEMQAEFPVTADAISTREKVLEDAQVVTGLKRPRPQEEFSEQQGSSNKVARAESSSVTSPDLGGSSSSSSGATRYMLELRHSGETKEKHAYVRIPAMAPGVSPRLFRPEITRGAFLLARSVGPLLKTIRILLQRPVLNAGDVEQLIFNSELLANYAVHRMTHSVETYPPGEAVRVLGTRFMLFNTLWSVYQVVGRKMQRELWWAQLVNRVQTKYTRPCLVGADEVATKNQCLAVDLSNALELYKNGQAPSESEVIRLKQRLFCDEDIKVFRRGGWQPWIDDC